ncbi:MAG: hypothetical protein COS84_09430 [Armatimonadetes bacterium CG07_land_8_20_14_0_80_40_9]|nr:MAG: hypothetical protein COS84_09430 [Armatimonadetes bacterium CG07_land_8_20_14_0_80_40_9]
MSVDNIVSKIIGDAELEAARVEKEATKEAEKIIQSAEGEAKSLKDELLSNAEDSAKQQKERIVAMAELEARKELLGEKQKLIEEAFQKALESLINLDDEKYQRLIEKLIIESANSGDERVIISSKDKERITQEFIDKVNANLIREGKKGELKLEEKLRDFKGGFIFKIGRKEETYTFEALLKSKREELEKEVAKILTVIV